MTSSMLSRMMLENIGSLNKPFLTRVATEPVRWPGQRESCDTDVTVRNVFKTESWVMPVS